MKISKGKIAVYLSAVLFIAALVTLQQADNLAYETSRKGQNVGVEIHIEKSHYRGGTLLSRDHHPGNLTTFGANYISDVLGDADGDQLDYIGLTNSTAAYNDNWIVLPDELTEDGLTRQIGTYADTGAGTWNISTTFTVTGSNSTQRAGLYHNVAGSTLCATDTFALTNVENGDSLQIVFMISVTD
jgi:hypothetical protein